jgi:hypothetical protein
MMIGRFFFSVFIRDLSCDSSPASPVVKLADDRSPQFRSSVNRDKLFVEFG